jgi:hypothetical protein
VIIKKYKKNQEKIQDILKKNVNFKFFKLLEIQIKYTNNQKLWKPNVCFYVMGIRF